jgi:hypothetical protein
VYIYLAIGMRKSESGMWSALAVNKNLDKLKEHIKEKLDSDLNVNILEINTESESFLLV